MEKGGREEVTPTSGNRDSRKEERGREAAVKQRGGQGPFSKGNTANIHRKCS